MREFINDYPIFSYIAVPILLIALAVLIYLTLKPRGGVKDHFASLYHKVLETIEFIGIEENAFTQEKLRELLRMISKIKSYYEMLESEELYEVEGIIRNIEKANSITMALIIAKSSELEIADFLKDIVFELNQVRAALYAFNLSRDDDSLGCFSLISTLGGKKSKEKASEYLKSIKKSQ